MFNQNSVGAFRYSELGNIVHQSVVASESLQCNEEVWRRTHDIIEHIKHARANQLGYMESKAIVVGELSRHVP